MSPTFYLIYLMHVCHILSHYSCIHSSFFMLLSAGLGLGSLVNHKVFVSFPADDGSHGAESCHWTRWPGSASSTQLRNLAALWALEYLPARQGDKVAKRHGCGAHALPSGPRGSFSPHKASRPRVMSALAPRAAHLLLGHAQRLRTRALGVGWRRGRHCDADSVLLAISVKSAVSPPEQLTVWHRPEDQGAEDADVHVQASRSRAVRTASAVLFVVISGNSELTDELDILNIYCLNSLKV